MAAQILPGLERKLKADITGDVMFDRFSRGRYATDASHYQMMPLGVVAPRTVAEAERAIAIAREEGVSVLPRGGGTSQSGQTVNESLVIDCSKHLTQIYELDIGDRRCTVEPGIVLDDLNRTLKPYGLWFPVDVSTASRATIGGMTANNSCGGRSLRYGTMRDNVLSIDAVLADGTKAHFGPVSAGLSNLPAGSPLRPLARGRCSTSGCARPTRSRCTSRKCSAASAATISTASRRTRRSTISRTSCSARKARSRSPRASS